MKKLIILFFINIPLLGYAQEPEFKVTKDYITDDIVTPCTEKSKEVIYKKTIEWIALNFKNSNEVIKSQIENEMIRMEGFTKSFSGTSDAGYTIEISFKDEKFKFDLTEFTIINGVNKFDFLATYSTYFKSDGSAKKRLEPTINAVSDLVNELNRSLGSYINDSNASMKKDDW